MFPKYQHIERLGTDEVDGILDGTVNVFSKLDGTNGVVWFDGEIKAGSRNRELTLERDNQGFYKHVLDDSRIKEYFEKYPGRILYGEWLVPHTLKTYVDEAWRRFWIFDVVGPDGYMEYNKYCIELEEFGLDYIPPVCEMENPTEESLYKLLDKNTFLIQDGKGAGEGIVIKRYDYVNRYGRMTWAKIVKNEFKEQNKKTFGVNTINGKTDIERKIIDEVLTDAFIEKEFAKVKANHDGWSTKYIPEFLGRAWSEFIKEEIWEILKKFKNPKIDFSKLNKYFIMRIKQIKPEVFK